MSSKKNLTISIPTFYDEAFSINKIIIFISSETYFYAVPNKPYIYFRFAVFTTTLRNVMYIGVYMYIIFRGSIFMLLDFEGNPPVFTIFNAYYYT